MCRITGILTNSVLSEALVTNMRDTLIHGGPDDAGIYTDLNDGIGLSQRRLSIIDLTEGGHQPMIDKQNTIVFNGEIYNYNEIKEELKAIGYEFNSESDTEVILKSFDAWGHDCVHKFRGMFAFAIWNKETKKLLLCRDRLGVKPMYWYLKDGLFMFASELKAFHQHPSFDKTINQEAVSLYLQTGYIRSPYCIFKFAHKLLPGSFLEIDHNFEPKIWKYWDVRQKYLETSVKDASEAELIDECEKILKESFQLRMVADVPVGMFLSGGIDSSLVTALLQSQSERPLNTFTIGFENKAFNEAGHAKLVAEHLKTNHTELYCTEKHFEEVIPMLPDIYDEPFGDSSGIPTFLVSRLARQQVTVSLSADAGDEIFTGYNRYLFAENLYDKFQKIPKVLRGVMSSGIEKLNINTVTKLINAIPIPSNYKKNIDARLPKLVEILKAENKLDFLYASSLFVTSTKLESIHQGDNGLKIFDKDLTIKENQLYGSYGVVDMESYLEGDILTKVDRATMKVALEGREPFLDHKIIEFALSLPDNMKIRDGQTKWILRQILYKYVPKELIERPKMGFGIPLDTWLSTILKQDLLTMCNDKEFFQIFNLNQVEVEKMTFSYLNKQGFSSHFIWYLYCLHQWYNKWIK